jgi:hypothetical protein
MRFWFISVLINGMTEELSGSKIMLTIVGKRSQTSSSITTLTKRDNGSRLAMIEGKDYYEF